MPLLTAVHHGRPFRSYHPRCCRPNLFKGLAGRSGVVMTGEAQCKLMDEYLSSFLSRHASTQTSSWAERGQTRDVMFVDSYDRS